MNYTCTLPPEDEPETSHMEIAIASVEKILKYTFRNKKLIEDALTHPSFTTSESYQRLEFIGDAALGAAISNYVFLAYPDVSPGKLSIVRSANISTENLARIAVRHKLYNYVRHNSPALGDKIGEFVMAVEQEDGGAVHGGLVKAPKVLADIVEAVVAAVYADLNFDLKAMWLKIRDLLEPIVMLDMLESQPQPVTMLFEICQKDGKRVDIHHWRKGDRNIASVYIDGKHIVSSSSEQKENAKLNVAKAALERLAYDQKEMMRINMVDHPNGNTEVLSAKQKLHEKCVTKKWPKPIYSVEEEFGRAHDKQYICSVKIETKDGILSAKGTEKSRRKDAENSAASKMFLGLQKSTQGQHVL